MKNHLKNLLLCLALLALPAIAGDAMHTYRGEVAGIMCSACSAKIKAAFSTMDGVKSVSVKPAKDGGAPKVEVISTSDKLTKDDAVKALGDDAKTFVVQSFGRAE
jgi:copper chaperone CopZ